jgi:peptidoglycan/LPS O-acetylase OafA/YrhL
LDDDHRVVVAAILVFAASCNEIGSGFALVVRPVAVASYSIYLVHPLALHVAGIACKGHVTLYFSLAIAVVGGSAAMFFFAVERTSIAIRDLRWARRTVQPAAQFAVDSIRS